MSGNVVVVAFDPTFDNRRINPALEIAARTSKN
jgi:hypothetical protein